MLQLRRNNTCVGGGGSRLAVKLKLRDSHEAFHMTETFPTDMNFLLVYICLWDIFNIYIYIYIYIDFIL